MGKAHVNAEFSTQRVPKGNDGDTLNAEIISLGLSHGGGCLKAMGSILLGQTAVLACRD